MGDFKLPRQVGLVLEQFPPGEWSRSLVNALNQFALEVVQSFRVAGVRYKTLSFTTGDAVEDSFPIDFPVEASPSEVRIAGVPRGDSAGVSAVTVKWQPIVAQGLAVRVNYITGLTSQTQYAIRLAYQ